MIYKRGNVERVAATAIDALKLESEGFKPLTKPKTVQAESEEIPFADHQQEVANRRGRKRKEE